MPFYEDGVLTDDNISVSRYSCVNILIWNTDKVRAVLRCESKTIIKNNPNHTTHRIGTAHITYQRCKILVNIWIYDSKSF